MANKAGLEGARRTARGGVVLGDVIVEVDGTPVRSTADLAEKSQATLFI